MTVAPGPLFTVRSGRVRQDPCRWTRCCDQEIILRYHVDRDRKGDLSLVLDSSVAVICERPQKPAWWTSAAGCPRNVSGYQSGRRLDRGSSLSRASSAELSNGRPISAECCDLEFGVVSPLVSRAAVARDPPLNAAFCPRGREGGRPQRDIDQPQLASDERVTVRCPAVGRKRNRS
jgi:hypothetical protein